MKSYFPHHVHWKTLTILYTIPKKNRIQSGPIFFSYFPWSLNDKTNWKVYIIHYRTIFKDAKFYFLTVWSMPFELWLGKLASNRIESYIFFSFLTLNCLFLHCLQLVGGAWRCYTDPHQSPSFPPPWNEPCFSEGVWCCLTLSRIFSALEIVMMM